MSKLIIGGMQSIAGSDGLMNAVNNAVEDGSNAFMVYLTAPQSTIRRPVEALNYEQMWEQTTRLGFKKEHLIVHAPYIINIATPDLTKREFARNFLISEVRRVDTCGFTRLVLHPGAHTGSGIQGGIENAAKVLNEVLAMTQNVKIALETMTGKGSELGGDINQLAAIIALIEDKSRIGICIDTCHLHDSGIDLAQFDTYLDEVEHLIGIDKVLVVHLNDSLSPRGAVKDRHANIGYGQIGFAQLVAVAHNPRLKDIPKILETPHINDKRHYKEEISILQNNKFVKFLD